MVNIEESIELSIPHWILEKNYFMDNQNLHISNAIFYQRRYNQTGPWADILKGRL